MKYIPFTVLAALCIASAALIHHAHPIVGGMFACLAMLYALGMVGARWKRATEEDERTILAILREGEASGAAIVEFAASRGVSLWHGTIYVKLRSMEGRGLIVPRTVPDGAGRRHYRLADKGNAST